MIKEVMESKMDNDKMRQKLEDFELINSVNIAVNRGDSLNKIIELVSIKTRKFFSSFGATVYLLSEDRKYLIMQKLNLPSVVKKSIESLIRVKITTVKILLGEKSHYYKILKGKKPQVINDNIKIKELLGEFAETIPENRKVMRAIIKKLIPEIYKILSIKSVMIVPLVTGGKVLGLMDISGRKPFESFDLERISAISGQLAIAINRKQTEDNLRFIFEEIKTSENRFKELFEHISSGVAVYEVRDDGNDFIFKDINRAGERIDKIKKKDVIGKSILKLFPEIKNFGVFDVFKRVYKTGKPEEHPISFYRDNRISGWRRNYIYKLPSGEIVSVFDDRTRQKQAEELLKISEEFASSLMKNSPTPIMVLNADYSLRYMNPAFEKLIGYKLSSMVGKKPPYPWWEKEMRKKSDEILKEISKKRVYYYSTLFLTKDGKTRYLDVISTPIKKNGKLKYIMGIGTDITERKKTEEEIVKSERNLKEAQSIAHIGSFNWNLVTNEISMSDEVYRILKINPKIFDRNFNTIINLFHPDDKEFALEAINDALKNKKLVDIEHKMLLGDKQEIFVGIKAKPFYDESNKPYKFMGTMMDITERKRAEEEIINSRERLEETLNGAINTLAAIVETKDPYTYGHQQRVCKLATTIAKELNIEENRIEAIRVSALIHDIGKVNIPASILSKAGKLTDIEFDMIKTHPQLSYNMLKNIKFPLPIVDIILQHHEKLDGSGYPNGLKGKDIMIEAKILTVADVVEAMSSHRPYRPALGLDTAIEEIRKNKGKLYDPGIVDACIKIINRKSFKFD